MQKFYCKPPNPASGCEEALNDRFGGYLPHPLAIGPSELDQFLERQAV
jgi:hypothetical protein